MTAAKKKKEPRRISPRKLADSRVFETAQAEGDPLIDGINSQIYKMMKVGSRSDRREREAAYNTGFSTPGGCTSMVFHKLTRLLALDADGNVRLLADNFSPEYIAEELRDCALYALRCADLMER